MGGAPALRVRVRVRGPPGERVREEGAQCLGCRRLGLASSTPCWGKRGWPGVQRTNRQSQGAWPLFCTLLFLKHYRPQTCCFPSPLVSLAPGLIQPNTCLSSMGIPDGELTLLCSRLMDISAHQNPFLLRGTSPFVPGTGEGSRREAGSGDPGRSARPSWPCWPTVCG